MLSFFRRQQTAEPPPPPPKSKAEKIEEAKAKVKETSERLLAAEEAIRVFAHKHNVVWNEFGGLAGSYSGDLIHWTPEMTAEYKALIDVQYAAKRDFNEACSAHAEEVYAGN